MPVYVFTEVRTHVRAAHCQKLQLLDGTVEITIIHRNLPDRIGSLAVLWTEDTSPMM